MKTILAIGGSVIKTAYNEVKQAARKGLFDVLIHNGGSIFHDFQLTTEVLKSHSYPLDKLLEDYECNRQASDLVWQWVLGKTAPKGSLTEICQRKGIKVMMFTVLGGDFWQLFDDSNRKCWTKIGLQAWFDFEELCSIMKEPFYFINMGSAVVMPEVFTKALAVVKPKFKFKADVVDFLPDQYRPKTRVSKYGKYWKMDHKEYMKMWLLGAKLK